MRIWWEKNTSPPRSSLKPMPPTGVLLWALTLAVASHSWRKELINFTTVITFSQWDYCLPLQCSEDLVITPHTYSDLPFQIVEPISWDPVMGVKWILHFANLPHTFPFQPNSCRNNKNKDIFREYQTFSTWLTSLSDCRMQNTCTQPEIKRLQLFCSLFFIQIPHEFSVPPFSS